MKFNDAKIEEILLKQNYVSEDDMVKAKAYAKSRRGQIIDYLLAKDLINKNILGQATAEYFKIPYADLGTHSATAENLALLKDELAYRYRLLVIKNTPTEITLATDDPEKTDLSAVLNNLFPNQKIILAYALSEDLDRALVAYRQNLVLRFQKIINDKNRIAPQILDEIIKDAIASRVSDIHLEPLINEALVRFRIDGVLHEMGRLPKANFENILNRIKVQANLRLDEHSDTQDGSIRFVGEDNNGADLRISIVPTLNGEKVAIRVLANYVKDLSMASLGLTQTQEDLLSRAIQKPFGMILVVGPTGSGKTTTLYAALKQVMRPEANITTIEDPVEYKIEGVNQIQVNPKTNLTFAKGLKTIVRQDPDVILVGEIRDQETVEISINAALTGHLLFSTFHANDAATAIPRLLDMGAEPFLLGSTLELIVSQRLVRQICENCRQSYKLDLSKFKTTFPEIEKYFSSGITLYRGNGCPNCDQTGFRGRIAVFEFIKLTPELKDLILTRPSSREISELARQQGSLSLFEDGVEKIKNGLTTIEELLRITQPPVDVKKYVAQERSPKK